MHIILHGQWYEVLVMSNSSLPLEGQGTAIHNKATSERRKCWCTGRCGGCGGGASSRNG